MTVGVNVKRHNASKFILEGIDDSPFDTFSFSIRHLIFGVCYCQSADQSTP
jgi:hypothetical protein